MDLFCLVLLQWCIFIQSQCSKQSTSLVQTSTTRNVGILHVGPNDYPMMILCYHLSWHCEREKAIATFPASTTTTNIPLRFLEGTTHNHSCCSFHNCSLQTACAIRETQPLLPPTLLLVFLDESRISQHDQSNHKSRIHLYSAVPRTLTYLQRAHRRPQIDKRLHEAAVWWCIYSNHWQGTVVESAQAVRKLLHCEAEVHCVQNGSRTTIISTIVALAMNGDFI
jgi:hypothetical protein